MPNKKSFIALLVLTTALAFGQVKTTEIGFITDNDLYTSSKNDMYYTNGLELFYRFLSKNDNPKINKKITEFRIGQYIYNPRFINAEAVTINDRPFTGYLFAEAGRSFFYQSESVLKTDFQVGFMGPNALGKETQESFHHIIGYKEVFGWENQLHNAFAVQAHVMYSKKMFPAKHNDFIDLHFQSEANVGTIFDGVSTGFLTRIGFKKLLPIYDSNLHDASVSSVPQYNIREFYFYAMPSVNYQFYDATIQGSMFSNTSPLTFELEPLRFNAEFGLKYRHNNFNMSYSFIYRGRELRDPETNTNSGYFYGSIRFGYLLK
ncbi:MAG: lipid A deacylase LpxR family protein [Flavobacterium piscis]|uniref:lipid A deacylase LpxR family protein n=1 Tax=Flavobacterium sp. KBS0721 TaxID=1179672 RepID=UPI00098F54AA|nr:lipid A deacylase LpxR family protein [Flavobacterium sp. KBS0721]MCA1920032.1 lipid A deacylase LpxR family protein [Flavobacterium piscis]QDW19155.1 lipid A deacylase LpxR family protein [Flavobacterium sp. KBS0721]